MGQSLEKITKKKNRLEQVHSYLHLTFTPELPATKKKKKKSNPPYKIQTKQTFYHFLNS